MLCEGCDAHLSEAHAPCTNTIHRQMELNQSPRPRTLPILQTHKSRLSREHPNERKHRLIPNRFSRQ